MLNLSQVNQSKFPFQIVKRLHFLVKFFCSVFLHTFVLHAKGNCGTNQKTYISYPHFFLLWSGYYFSSFLLFLKAFDFSFFHIYNIMVNYRSPSLLQQPQKVDYTASLNVTHGWNTIAQNVLFYILSKNKTNT